jgi:hypothetical protein
MRSFFSSALALLALAGFGCNKSAESTTSGGQPKGTSTLAVTEVTLYVPGMT